MCEQPLADMDGGWKQIIEDYLEEFFHFFFPQVHAAIDFRRECQSLDKELAKIMVGAEVGDREVDKLIQVHWHDGGDGSGVGPRRGAGAGRIGFRPADVRV